MAILKLITQPSSVMDKAIASAAGPLKVMKAPTGMNFAIEIDVDKAIIKSIEKDPLLQSIMVDKAGEIYEDLVSRIGKNLQATDKGAVTLKDAGQTEKLEKLITVVNKGIEEARKIAVDRAQKEVLKAWDELVKARKEYTKYKIKIGVKITTGLAGLAVSIGLLAGGVVSFGASSIPGIVGMVKSTAAIGAQIVSASQEIETAQKRLDGNLKTIEQRFVNAKGEFTKKGKSQEAGAALLLFCLYGLGAAAMLRLRRGDGPFDQTALAGAVGTLFVLLTLLIRYAFHGADMRAPTGGEGLETWTFSALWAVFGLAVLSLGAARKDIVLRWAGLAALLAVAGVD